jgi:hypothetical protein
MASWLRISRISQGWQTERKNWWFEGLSWLSHVLGSL